jgi:hypothetical protein
MRILHDPAARVGAHQVDRHHDVAVLALQLHVERLQVGRASVAGGTVDDAIPGMIEVFLDDGEPLLQFLRLHPGHGGAAFGAPDLAHHGQIVRLDGPEKQDQRVVHRRRRGSRDAGVTAGGGDAE